MKNLKLRRIIAATLDYFICFYLFYIPAEFLNKKIQGINEIFATLISAFIVILIIALFSVKDILYKNRSIGKKIFKLAIYIDETKEIPNKIILVKRSLISLFTGGINFFTVVFCGKSIGDFIYKTNVENFENHILKK